MKNNKKTIIVDIPKGKTTTINQKILRAHRVIGRINENSFMIIKDRFGDHEKGKIYTKDELFLELL